MSKTIVCMLATILSCVCFANNAWGGDSRAEVLERVGADIEFLSSDKLEGRGVQTKGIELAASRIIEAYKEAGLKPGMPDGTYRQGFDITVGAVGISKDCKVAFTIGSEAIELESGKEYQPLQRGGDGSCEGDLVFIGYGINAEEESYNDYDGIDVEGKIVVLIRREPHQGRVDGSFKGTETTSHSYIDTKLKLAKEAKAAGIIFVNDAHSAPTPDKDDLTTAGGFGTRGAGIPFVHVKQAAVDRILKAHPIIAKSDDGEEKLTTLSDVCLHIDKTMKPLSQPMTGVTAKIAAKFDSETVKAFNLVGVLEGEGELADETIIIGGHYDHIGYGGYGSRAKNRKGEIHNGADDNATGTAAVMEMVRRVTQGPTPKRRIVFICFSGEERGLLGSRHYVKEPVFPLEKTVTMLNFDMIGSLRNNNVEVNGVGTAREFRPIVEAAADNSALRAKIIEHPFAGSDHLPFFQKEIPVMFSFTGVTPRYHTPDDDFETINVDGVVSIIEFTEQLLRGIDGLAVAPTFQKVSRRSRSPRQTPRLGIVPNLGTDGEEDGVPIQAVRPNSPASKAGIKVGDVIVKAGDKETKEFGDLLQLIQKSKPGQELNLVIQRGKESVEVNVTLGNPR